MTFLLLAACSGKTIALRDIETPEDVEDACARYEPETVTLSVVFPAQEETCPWGEGDNTPPNDGYLAARVEQTEALDLPDEAVICDLGFDFTGLVPDEVQVMVYDDHFFFTFNDIVLASSLQPAVAELPGDLPTWDWPSVAGLDYHALGDNYDSYCLGEDEGDSTCEIPQTEQTGAISMTFGESLVAELSLTAIEDQRFDFAFVTAGDDDADVDCRHDAFGFTVEVPYLTP
jgi:hypothetical protein